MFVKYLVIFIGLYSATYSVVADFNAESVGIKDYYSVPKGCKTNHCQYLLTWKRNDDRVEFEFITNLNASLTQKVWSAIGFNKERHMQKTSVVDCIVNASDHFSVEIQSSFNPDRYNEVLAPNNKLGLVPSSLIGSVEDGSLVCKFHRYISANASEVNSNLVYDLNQKYYLILANGIATDNGEKKKHTQIPHISSSLISFVDRHNDSIFNETGCGITKGCYLVPDGCSRHTCTYMVTWVKKNDYVELEFVADVTSVSSATPWAAFGINTLQQMPLTSVIDCIVNNSDHSSVFIQASFNPEHYNEVVAPNNKLGFVPGSLNGSYVDGVITCRFSRYINISLSEKSHEKVYNLTQPYYIILAQGAATEDGVKMQHTLQPVISAAMINLLANVDVMSSLQYNLVKAHASLMVLAWMLLASIGVLTSRHFKLAWALPMYCGKAIWFQIHRLCMTLVFLSTITAFTLIVIELQGFRFNTVHPILGICIVPLAVINPIMALFRPHPDAPRRIYFNWAHRSVGTLAHLGAAVAMFFGTGEGKAQLPSWTKWLVVGFVGWTILTELLLFLVTRYIMHSERYEMIDPQNNGGKCYGPKTLIMILYVIGVSGIVSTLLYYIIVV